MTYHPGGVTLSTVHGGPEMVFHVDDVWEGYTTSCELVSAAGSPSAEHGGMSKASWVARDICTKEACPTVRKEPERGDTYSADLPVPGRIEHSDWVLCRAHFVWDLLLWGRDR